MPNFCPNFQSPVTHLSAVSAIWGTCSKQFEAMPQRKKASTASIHNLGSWATGEADLTSIRPDTPDDPDYESILALSEGLETASEDNMDPESAIKASMKGFYQVFHPQQRCNNLLEAERTKVCSLLLPLYIVRLIILFQKRKIGSCPPTYTGNSVRSAVCQKVNSAARARSVHSVQDCDSHAFCNYFTVHFI